MKRFRDSSLRTKLTVLVACASSAGLITAFIAITFNEVRTFAPQARDALSTQAASIAFHASASLLFRDAEDATHTLASLATSSDIVAAALYQTDGTRFAHYQRADNTDAQVPAGPGPDGTRFLGRHLTLVAPVMHAGERVGTLYLQSDLRSLYDQVATYLGLVAMLIVAGIIVAIVVAALLGRLITDQVRGLARVAEHVTQRKDYTVRAAKRTGDEIGVLIDAFNQMMEQIQLRDGELRHIQSDLAGRVRERTAALEAINQDLSAEVAARKAVEAQLIVARDRAEAANRAKSTFLANMSHELRTPLTAVIGYSELLAENAADLGDARQVEDLKRISTAANHLLHLLSDLLDLSRIEVGRLELQPEVIALPAFMAEFEATARPLCDAKRNAFVINCAPGIGPLTADRTRLRQVLLNLVSNAAKFTTQGQVRLDVSANGTPGADAVRFAVRDTGIGIPQEHMERIFEPFVQGHAGIALAYGGSGLGLAICKKCCDLMGGTITVQSEPGRGTTFTVTFPCHGAKAA